MTVAVPEPAVAGVPLITRVPSIKGDARREVNGRISRGRSARGFGDRNRRDGRIPCPGLRITSADGEMQGRQVQAQLVSVMVAALSVKP